MFALRRKVGVLNRVANMFCRGERGQTNRITGEHDVSSEYSTEPDGKEVEKKMKS